MRITDQVNFVAAVVLCCSALVVILASFGPFSLELFVTVSIVVFVTIAEVTSSRWSPSRWYFRIRWIVVLALLVFTVLLVRRLMRLIPSFGG